MTKVSESSENEKLQFDEEGLPINKEDEEESVKYPKEKKPSFLEKIREIFKKRDSKIKGVPVTFNVGLSVILFVVYFIVLIVGMQRDPYLLFIIIPTLYILIRHIKLEREQLGEKFG